MVRVCAGARRFFRGVGAAAASDRGVALCRSGGRYPFDPDVSAHPQAQPLSRVSAAMEETSRSVRPSSALSISAGSSRVLR
jgi:hypothetical protein